MAMTETLEQFRKRYDAQIPRWYRGWAHYLGTTLMSLPLVVFALLHIQSLTVLEWASIPLFVVMASGVEYATHRFLLHRPRKLLYKGYHEHTIQHHSYFTHDATVALHNRAFHRVFFPVWGIAAGTFGFTLPVAIAISRVTTENLGYLMMITGAAFFFIYETVHMMCHLPENHWLLSIPGARAAREHHRLHHDKALMGRYNFNVVFPLWDWICGTTSKGRL